MTTDTTVKDVRIRVDYDNSDNTLYFLNLGNQTAGNDVKSQAPPVSPPVQLPANVKDNPWVANANTGPELRVDDRDPILPRPWRKVKHLIIATLVATLMCFCLSAIANKFAWRARNLKLLHRYEEAKYWARRSVILFYVSLVFGIVMIGVIISAIVAKFERDGKIVID